MKIHQRGKSTFTQTVATKDQNAIQVQNRLHFEQMMLHNHIHRVIIMLSSYLHVFR